MKKRKLLIILPLLILILCLCSCSYKSHNSSFCIQFIDVGQGDAALIECDGHYMLIDGGDKSASDKVYNVLKEQNIQCLDILAVSHLHADHIGGLAKALTYATKIGVTISNSDYSETDAFKKLSHELAINGSQITIPSVGDEYKLGSATVEVIDVCADEENDSLVLLITYGNTKFLFTGDIEEDAQTRISEKYQNESDEPYEIDLIKMPHHGSYTGTLYQFLRTFMPEYAVISVGVGNNYGHPDEKTLDLLNSKNWKPKIYRTDHDGDIIVQSNGKELSVKTSK